MRGIQLLYDTMSGVSIIKLRRVLRGANVTFEYLVNGKLLTDIIAGFEGPCDDISPLGWIEGARERLLLDAPPDLPQGRTSILVCSPCGDQGCGAVSAVVSRHGERVAWSSMGVANNLGVDDGSPWLYQKVKGFEFAWAQYKEALTHSDVVFGREPDAV